MTAVEVYQFISSGGFPAILTLVIWTGYKSVWVWGKELERERADHRQTKAERDRGIRFVQDKALPAIIAFTQAADRLLQKESRNE